MFKMSKSKFKFKYKTYFKPVGDSDWDTLTEYMNRDFNTFLYKNRIEHL